MASATQFGSTVFVGYDFPARRYFVERDRRCIGTFADQRYAELFATLIRRRCEGIEDGPDATFGSCSGS